VMGSPQSIAMAGDSIQPGRSATIYKETGRGFLRQKVRFFRAWPAY
jgi:hypothetical protein